jgi:hypothetical protein
MPCKRPRGLYYHEANVGNPRAERDFDDRARRPIFFGRRAVPGQKRLPVTEAEVESISTNLPNDTDQLIEAYGAGPRNCTIFRAIRRIPRRRNQIERSMQLGNLSARTKENLNKQGFGNLDEETQSRYSHPLRFTPGIAAILILVGLILQSPIWLWAMAMIALSGALLPKGMIIDLFYNFGIRHLFRAPPLPPTPKPRQFSYWISTILLAGSGLAFHYRQPLWGFIFGGFVVAGATILATTLWCLGSWFYRLVFWNQSDRR